MRAPTIAFQYTLDGTVTRVTEFGSLSNFGPDTTLNISQCGKTDFQYWVIPPYFPFGYTLMGELNKITPVSEQRFSDVILNDDVVMVKVSGVPGEKVPVTVYSTFTKKPQVINCTISESGDNWLVLGGACYGA